MKRYKLSKDEATADIAFIAYGKDLSELFRNISIAVSNIMVLNAEVNRTKKINFTIHSCI